MDTELVQMMRYIASNYLTEFSWLPIQNNLSITGFMNLSGGMPMEIEYISSYSIDVNYMADYDYDFCVISMNEESYNLSNS